MKKKYWKSESALAVHVKPDIVSLELDFQIARGGNERVGYCRWNSKLQPDQTEKYLQKNWAQVVTIWNCN